MDGGKKLFKGVSKKSKNEAFQCNVTFIFLII
jgi:hypothetical protein